MNDDMNATPPPAMRSMKAGTLVKHQGRTYQIKETIDSSTVTAIDVGSRRTAVLKASEIETIAPAPDHVRRMFLDELTPEQRRIAHERLASIAPILKMPTYSAHDVKARAAEVGRHPTTLYRWIRLYTATNDYTSLVPRKRGWTKGHTRIPTFAEDVIDEVIQNYYLTTMRPSGKKTIEEVQRQCAKRGIQAPGPSTIRARLARLPEDIRLAQRGEPDRARTRYQPAPDSFPDANYPLAVVQIDHTQADIILVDDIDREPIGRPWVTIATDIFSRMITGYYLSFEAPSVTSVAMCITHSIIPKEDWLTRHNVPDAEWPVWGFPTKFHVDNGPDFRATDIQAACAKHGVNIEYRPLDKTHYGGNVERLLRNIMENLRGVPGYTSPSIAERGEGDPEKHAAMTKGEFERWLLTWICKRYHQETHKATGTSPTGRWEHGLIGDTKSPGPGIPERPAAPADLVRDFLPSYRRTVQKQGVTIDRLWYWADVLRPWIQRPDPDDRANTLRLTFRRDPRDISSLWFFDPDVRQYYKIPLANQAIQPMSLWEYKRNRKKLAMEGTARPNSVQLVHAVDEMRQIEEDAQGRTKQAKRARRDRQRRSDHATALDPAAPSPRSPTSQPSPSEPELTDEPIEPFPFHR